MSNNKYRAESVLSKDTIHKKVCGVCSGLARHFELPRLGVRAAVVVLGFMMPVATIVAYFVAALIMPNRY